MKLGIIPAAGKGSRWNGFHKMILPCGEGEYLIDRVIESMLLGGADAINVVYSQSTLPILKEHLAHRYPQVHYVEQRDPLDIWGAILSGMSPGASYYYFAMPDTYFPKDIFEAMANTAEKHSFQVGSFETMDLPRYGVLSENGREWLNKQPKVDLRYHTAWGVLGWSDTLAGVLRERNPINYTDAINHAWNYGLESMRRLIPMEYYYDMATFEDYRALLQVIN